MYKNMKKIVALLIAVFALTGNAIADDTKTNPFFGTKQNQAAVTLGQGFDSGELIAFKHLNHPAPYYMLLMTYSQPTEFFRLPARQNINGTLTYGLRDGNWDGGCRHSSCNWSDYNAQIFTLSEDVALLYNERAYFAVGMGVGVQGKYNERLNTKFLLGFKLSFGYRFNDTWGIELAMQHYSNADTGTSNSVYDFWGLGATYSF